MSTSIIDLVKGITLLATHAVTDTKTTTPGAGRAAWRAGGHAAVIAATGSLALYAAARLAGTDFQITPAGAARGTDVTAAFVLVSIAVPLLLGTLLLRALSGRARAWSALAWTGLGLGIVTIATPLMAEADTGARLTLAVMHVVTGAAWWYAVRHNSPKEKHSS